MYLGASLKKVRNATQHECWGMSSEKYVKAAVDNVDEKLKKTGARLNPASTPFSNATYHPADDVTKELDADGVQYYQELIGVIRWAIEIGRIDILLEVSLLSVHLALPRVGHLQQVYHIFGYLKKNVKRSLYFDPTTPKYIGSKYKPYEWQDFYADAKENIPHNMPEPRGKPMRTSCFVDASHAAAKSNRLSQTGIIIFCMRAPVMFHCKKQSGVEPSTFGSEFVALKTAVELIQGLRYKLRMFGVPLEDFTEVRCDNEAVFKNASRPDSTLNKKQHSIAYHFCREAVAAGIIMVVKEDTNTNLSDLLTKVLGRVKRDSLIDMFMY